MCIPRRCFSGAALLAADVETTFRGPQVSEAIDKISDVVCNWNADVTYSSAKYNCQTFIDELCKVLNIKLEFKGSLGNFVKNLRATGQCDITYTPAQIVCTKLNLANEVITFNTHRELDDFVTKVREKVPQYFELDPVGKDDWKLLKSFDRAFWLRKFKYMDQKKAKAQDMDQWEPHECPFNNPLDSGSILDWKQKR